MPRIIRNKKLITKTKTKKLKGCWRTLTRFSRASKKRIYGGNPPDNNNQAPATSNKYKCTVLLGKGTYGIVIGCNKAGKTIAIKFLDTSKINPDNNIKRARAIVSFDREKAIHSQLAHENIVTFLSDIARDDLELSQDLNITSSEFFALEHCEQGSLAAYLIYMNGQPVNRQSIISQIFAGLKYLYDAHIIHLDLKPQNILVTGGVEPTFKIADFGLAKLLTATDIPTSQLRCGTMEYIPYFAQNTTFFRDLYAFYCIIYYIATCKHINAGKEKKGNKMAVEKIDAEQYGHSPFSWLNPICAILFELQDNKTLTTKQKTRTPAPGYSNAGIGNMPGVEHLDKIQAPRLIVKAVMKQAPVNYKLYTTTYNELGKAISKLTPPGNINIPATPVKVIAPPKPSIPKSPVFSDAVKTLILDSEADPDLAINPPLTPVKRADFPERLN